VNLWQGVIILVLWWFYGLNFVLRFFSLPILFGIPSLLWGQIDVDWIETVL
jgi:hypothetical protein